MSNKDFKCPHHRLVELMIREVGLTAAKDMVKQVRDEYAELYGERIAEVFQEQMVQIAREVKAEIRAEKAMIEAAEQSVESVQPMLSDTPTIEEVESKLKQMFPSAQIVHLKIPAREETLVEEVPENLSKLMGMSDCDCPRCKTMRERREAEQGKLN